MAGRCCPEVRGCRGEWGSPAQQCLGGTGAERGAMAGWKTEPEPAGQRGVPGFFFSMQAGVMTCASILFLSLFLLSQPLTGNLLLSSWSGHESKGDLLVLSWPERRDL